MLRKLSLLFFLVVIITLCTVLYALRPVLADDDINVTGTVPPQADDFQFELTTNSPSEKKQGEDFMYEIIYGASSSAGMTTATTLTASWKDTKAPDGSTVVDYESGSTTKAYGNTSPVVDLLNKTITWNIASLPKGVMDQKVQFKLKLIGSYSGTESVPFTTTATMSNDYVTLPQQSLTRHYKYIAPPPPTPTPATPVTPTPTKTPQKAIGIANVSMTRVTATDANIAVSMTSGGTLMIRYGTAANNLSQSVTLKSGQNAEQTIHLEGLRAETTYYFQVTAINEANRRTVSDIYTFTTAKVSTPPTGEDNIVIITSNGTVLVSDVKEKDRTGTAMALVTTDTPYEITYRLRKKLSLKSIEAVMRRTPNVTGLGQNQQPVLGTNEMVIAMQEKEPLVYVARLRTDTSGTFDIFVRMQDTKGNLIEEKIAATKIMPLLSVYDAATNEPVADTRIFISFYNLKTNRFEPISPLLFENVQNPTYTNHSGTAKLLLPPGRYRLEVSGFGYDERTIEFTLGTKPGEDFPKILLHKNATNLMNYIQYYSGALLDIALNVQTSVQGLAISVRFFNIIAGLILFLAIAATILFFHLRTRVSAWHLIPYFIHHFKELFHKHSIQRFCATITDETGRKVSDARIATIDSSTGEVVTTFISNNNGICYVLNPGQQKQLKLLITKEGFSPKTVAIESDFQVSDHGLAIVLRKGQKPSNKGKLWELTEHVGGLFFEVSLLGSIVLEMLFFSLFGFAKTFPFFLLSLFTLLLWIFYQKEKQSRKVFKKP